MQITKLIQSYQKCIKSNRPLLTEGGLILCLALFRQDMVLQVLKALGHLHRSWLLLSAGW